MVHLNSNSANGSVRVGSRMLATLSLVLLALTGFAQDGSPTPAPAEEGLTRAEIISYIVSAVAFIIIIVFAWILGSGKAKKKSAHLAQHTPGLRISSAHTNDPYMRKRVVKKTS